MRKRKMFPFLAAGIVALASCNTPQKEVVKIAAINPANMDTTVAAGTVFMNTLVVDGLRIIL